MRLAACDGCEGGGDSMRKISMPGADLCMFDFGADEQLWLVQKDCRNYLYAIEHADGRREELYLMQQGHRHIDCGMSFLTRGDFREEKWTMTVNKRLVATLARMFEREPCGVKAPRRVEVMSFFEAEEYFNKHNREWINSPVFEVLQ